MIKDLPNPEWLDETIEFCQISLDKKLKVTMNLNFKLAFFYLFHSIACYMMSVFCFIVTFFTIYLEPTNYHLFFYLIIGCVSLYFYFYTLKYFIKHITKWAIIKSYE